MINIFALIKQIFFSAVPWSLARRKAGTETGAGPVEHMLQRLRPDRGGGLRVQQGRQLPQQVRHRGHQEGAVQPAGQRRHGQHEQARGHGQGQPQDADIHNGRLVKSNYEIS